MARRALLSRALKVVWSTRSTSSVRCLDSDYRWGALMSAGLLHCKSRCSYKTIPFLGKLGKIEAVTLSKGTLTVTLRDSFASFYISSVPCLLTKSAFYFLSSAIADFIFFKLAAAGVVLRTPRLNWLIFVMKVSTEERVVKSAYYWRLGPIVFSFAEPLCPLANLATRPYPFDLYCTNVGFGLVSSLLFFGTGNGLLSVEVCFVKARGFRPCSGLLF